MTTKYCKTALTIGLICLPLLPNVSQAEVTPDQFNLLMVAAEKDGGKDFATLVELLVAANPGDEEEIRRVAAQVMPEPVRQRHQHHYLLKGQFSQTVVRRNFPNCSCLVGIRK